MLTEANFLILPMLSNDPRDYFLGVHVQILVFQVCWDEIVLAARKHGWVIAEVDAGGLPITTLASSNLFVKASFLRLASCVGSPSS
jgi:hypothetical protein